MQKDKDSKHDFGMNIIPAMLNDNKKLYAWEFDGYWKDVGTVDSLWEANMDLLKDKDLDLYNIKKDWKIYTEDTLGKPQISVKKQKLKTLLLLKDVWLTELLKDLFYSIMSMLEKAQKLLTLY